MHPRPESAADSAMRHNVAQFKWSVKGIIMIVIVQMARVQARAAAPTLHCVLPHNQLSQSAAPPAEGRRVGSPRAMHG